jgi:hypothetical protein
MLEVCSPIIKQLHTLFCIHRILDGSIDQVMYQYHT